MDSHHRSPAYETGEDDWTPLFCDKFGAPWQNWTAVSWLQNRRNTVIRKGLKGLSEGYLSLLRGLNSLSRLEEVLHLSRSNTRYHLAVTCDSTPTSTLKYGAPVVNWTPVSSLPKMCSGHWTTGAKLFGLYWGIEPSPLDSQSSLLPLH